MPRLEGWSTIAASKNPFLAPEFCPTSLHGEVYGHSRFADGTVIVTSTVKELDLKLKLAKTKNTIYELGTPSKEFLDYLTKQGKTLEDYYV